MPPGCGPAEIYSTNPLISQLGSAYFPLRTVFLIAPGFGFSSKLPFFRKPEERDQTESK
jgi:hypothetical protein